VHEPPSSSLHGSGIKEIDELVIVAVFKALHTQAKFWKPCSQTSIPYIFLYKFDGRFIDFINPQLMHCIVCYKNKPSLHSLFNEQNVGRVLSFISKLMAS